MDLQQFFKENPRVAIAFSGGVDSSYLLYAALRYGARVRAYYVNSAFQPRFELEDARRLAGDLHADLRELQVDVLSSPTVTANPPDRCYHCKRVIFRTIAAAAAEDGFRCCWTAPTPPTTPGIAPACGLCGSCRSGLPCGSAA